MHLAVSDPAVEGEGIDVALRGFHFHFGQEPGVLWEHQEPLLVEFNQKQLPDGRRGGHGEFGHLGGAGEKKKGVYLHVSIGEISNIILIN